MIVVVSSRHDPVAMDLVESWPQASLCSAQDLVRPGWLWEVVPRGRQTWVVDRQLVRDEEVTGVFIRRPAVLPGELVNVHPDDRAFLAAEVQAFLTFVLATTRARVVNPVVNGAFGEEILQSQSYFAHAERAEVPVHMPPLADSPAKRAPPKVKWWVEVVAGESFSEGPRSVNERACVLAASAGLDWAAFSFDARRRLLGATSMRPPSSAAVESLAKLLSRRAG